MRVKLYNGTLSPQFIDLYGKKKNEDTIMLGPKGTTYVDSFTSLDNVKSLQSRLPRGVTLRIIK